MKKRISVIIMCLAILNMLVSVSAAEWVEVKTASSEQSFKFESDSIQQHWRDIILYKVKVERTLSPQLASRQKGDWQKVRRINSTEEININENIARTLSFAAYDENGDWVIGNTTGGNWRKFDTNSAFGDVQKYILENREAINAKPKY